MKTPTQQDDELAKAIDELYFDFSVSREEFLALIHDREAKAERRGRIAGIKRIKDGALDELLATSFTDRIATEIISALAIASDKRLSELTAQSEQEGSER